MNHPALDWFECDSRVKPRHMLVFRYCRQELDGWDVRDLKRENVLDATGVDKADVTRVLNELAQWGYLLEHPREEGQFSARRFTLTYSLSTEQRAAHKAAQRRRGRGGKTPPQETAATGAIAA